MLSNCKAVPRPDKKPIVARKQINKWCNTQWWHDLSMVSRTFTKFWKNLFVKCSNQSLQSSNCQVSLFSMWIILPQSFSLTFSDNPNDRPKIVRQRCLNIAINQKQKKRPSFQTKPKQRHPNKPTAPTKHRQTRTKPPGQAIFKEKTRAHTHTLTQATLL